MSAAVSVSEFLEVLESLAPLELAAEWDNVGLLIEGRARRVSRIMLTLDLTPAVAREAVRGKVDWLVCYHPPIFSGLKSLTREVPMSAALLDLIGAGISVYSPHTALDAAPEGVSDWLAGCCPEAASVENPGRSARKLRLRRAVSAAELGAQLRRTLDLPYLRVAAPAGRRRAIRHLGLCPGAGASALAELGDLDAVFTGEMRHHDLLRWQSTGVWVLLGEHGRTERPYLKILESRLRARLPAGVRVSRSRCDREALELQTDHA